MWKCWVQRTPGGLLRGEGAAPRKAAGDAVRSLGQHRLRLLSLQQLQSQPSHTRLPSNRNFKLTDRFQRAHAAENLIFKSSREEGGDNIKSSVVSSAAFRGLTQQLAGRSSTNHRLKVIHKVARVNQHLEGGAGMGKVQPAPRGPCTAAIVWACRAPPDTAKIQPCPSASTWGIIP